MKKNDWEPKEEYELPETVFVRDIEDQVFKTIVMNCLRKLEGVSLDGGGFFDHLFGRDTVDGIKGVSVTQSSDSPSVSLKIEVKIEYGYSIPEKTGEIQTALANEITEFTGLHVSEVHVVVKRVYAPREEIDESEQVESVVE